MKKSRALMKLVSRAQRARLSNGKPALSILVAFAAIAAVPVAGEAQTPPAPVTPIQHVIVIFGENRSFDHVFGTYVPRKGETVWNLYSLGIVCADGTPGPNYARSHQFSAVDSTCTPSTPATSRFTLTFHLPALPARIPPRAIPAPLRSRPWRRLSSTNRTCPSSRTLAYITASSGIHEFVTQTLFASHKGVLSSS
jgi:hypothetical protein